MKLILRSIIFCSFLVFICCQSEESEKGYGIISFYTGEVANIEALAKQQWPDFNLVNEGYMFLKKIEISTTGQEWINLIDKQEAIPIRFEYKGELIKVPIEDVLVPEGEYHGVRISLEPKIRILSLGDLDSLDILLEQEPIAIYVRMGMSQLKSSIDTLEFTSANGYLIPFTVEKDLETRIIIGSPEKVVNILI